MTLSRERSTEPAIVEALLALPTLQQQADLLEAEGLLDPDGMHRLLDAADRSAGSDPGKARRLAEVCAGLADRAQAPDAVPRATYIRAGTHGINGEFDEELRLTRVARDGYVALGKNLEALRTNVGLMAVLLELGRYGEALDAGRVVLDTLAGGGELAVAPTLEQSELLTAFVHQNRGGCYEYMGRYEEALDAYTAAQKRYRALGMDERLGEILDNRGGILLHLGRGSEALQAHEAAAAIFEEAGLTLSHAKALANIGEGHLRLANYTRSLEALERARRLFSSLGALADEYLLLRNTADAYLELNLYSEALAAYAEVNELLRGAGMVHDRARALWGMGSVLIARSELKEAERALAGAATMFAEADNVPLLCGVMLEQASLLAAREEWGVALQTAYRALNLVSENDWPVQQFYAHLRLADLLIPDATRAEPHLLAARRLADRLALPHLSYRLHERLGHLRRLQGREEEARTLLESAVEEIERLRGTVSHEAVRASFLRDKTAAYEDLLRLHLDRDGEENCRGAFCVAEQAKSRALVDLLTGVVEKGAEDPELEERLRSLKADLNATYGQLLGATTEDEREMPVADLQERAVGLEREISRLRLHAAATDPFSVPAPRGDSGGRLPTDVTLLAYHVVGDEVVAFVNGREGLHVAREVCSAAVVERLLWQLDVQWDRFRAGPGFVGRHMKVLERSTRQTLASLYAELVAPLEPLLAGAEGPTPGATPHKLAVVPHGPLHRVPFHALYGGGRYLLERFEISYAPSARVYTLCQGQAPRGPGGAALVVSVADPLIPAVAGEARAVARHLPEAEVLGDEEATTDALRSRASGREVLHLACHGLFRSDNPMFSALKLHDGWLTAAEVMQLDLSGALVTLSACESGRNEVFAGDELIGLTRAFLGAGASTLAVSLWVVQDETTALLMEKWYGRLRDGAGRAEALRAAQLELKEESPHPYYWAPFVLIGKR